MTVADDVSTGRTAVKPLDVPAVFKECGLTALVVFGLAVEMVPAG
jgi:hypothetical protein